MSALLKTLYSVSKLLDFCILSDVANEATQVNLLFLLFLLMYVFGIVGFYFWGQEDGDQEHWGTLPNALLTLFAYATVSRWRLCPTSILFLNRYDRPMDGQCSRTSSMLVVWQNLAYSQSFSSSSLISSLRIYLLGKSHLRWARDANSTNAMKLP